LVCHLGTIFCYIDPGAGGMLLQLLLGGLAGLWVAFKLWGKRIMEYLGIGKKAEHDPPPR